MDAGGGGENEEKTQRNFELESRIFERPHIE